MVYMCMCLCVCVCVFVRVRVCAYARVCVCVSVHMHVCLCACVYACLCICVCVCVCLLLLCPPHCLCSLIFQSSFLSKVSSSLYTVNTHLLIKRRKREFLQFSLLLTDLLNKKSHTEKQGTNQYINLKLSTLCVCVSVCVCVCVSLF